MKRIKQILVCGLSILLCISCFTTTNTPIPSVVSQPSQVWWSLFLDQPVCKPPCWENITPGQTTNEDALSILKQVPAIKITYQSKFGIDWAVKEDKTMSGFLKSSEDNVVAVIALGASRYSKLTLETAVAAYGYPSFVEPYDCREGMCATNLVYPDLGMFLDVFIEDLGNHKVDIQPDTEVGRVMLIAAGLENYKNISDSQDYGILMSWKGYGKYP